MATVQACSAAGGFVVPPDRAARIGQWAEHTFVGMKSGLMDQLASALGQVGHVLLIDCRNLEYEPIPVPEGTVLLIADTAVRRELASSAYNERRAQCEMAAAAMGTPALRDATLARLAGVEVDDVVRRRARHVITENARVLETVAALKSGNLDRVGALMDQSHVSLRDDYEVSCPELDTMVELLREQPGCHGARLTGAGFGGCAVALMQAAAVQDAVAVVTSAYREHTQLTPSLFPTHAARGAEVLHRD
jgi:galactokinase